MSNRLLVGVLWLFIAAHSPCWAANVIWIEGEDPLATTIRQPMDMGKPGHRLPEQQAKLSAGRWLTIGETLDGAPATISYSVRVLASGNYQFYVRKFWRHGPFRWRFDEAEWRTCGKDIALLDDCFLEKYWGANWVALGSVDLKEGERRLEIEMIENKGCIDCLLLTDGVFTPRGKLKPGQQSTDAEPGFFAFDPVQDPVDGKSPINLCYLNEAAAGESGFVRRDGQVFRLGSGKAVRFWGVEADAVIDMQRSDVDRWCRRLAKYGVNLVRLNMSRFFTAHVNGDTQGFARSLDKLHYLVAALKDQGIYTYLGVLYWHTHHPLPAGIIPGFERSEAAIALPFFAPQFEGFYRQYAGKILTPKNPYTNLSLAKDPAVAFLEINNESGLLFYTFNPASFSAPESELVERSFADWLIGKYSSLADARKVWGTDQSKHTPDRFNEGRVGLYSAAQLQGAAWAARQRNPKRAEDQVQWMVESMRDYYHRFKTILTVDLGAEQLITGSNWTTADERVLGGLERYGYTVTDAVMRNGYFGPQYPNKAARQAFHAVELGDTYASHSALKAPMKPGPLATPQIAGYPYLVSECNWKRPLRFRAEYPVLVAGYASLTGTDAFNFYMLDGADWQTPMTVTEVNTPAVLGQFPAAALMYRRGDVREAKRAAVHERVSLSDAYALKGTRTYALGDVESMWADLIEAQGGAVSDVKNRIDPRAFFVGPVLHEFHEGVSEVDMIDLTDYIDAEKTTVTSLTGELVWNYGTGVMRIDTPRAQGATGFLAAAGRIVLSEVVIESANEYGSVLVVSLDGLPLSKSQKVLIQCVTEDQPYGFRTKREGDFRKITDLGGYPLNVRRINAQVSVDGPVRSTLVLDCNGRMTDRHAVARRGDQGLEVRLPEDAIYTLLH